jgi:hypothetical protein
MALATTNQADRPQRRHVDASHRQHGGRRLARDALAACRGDQGPLDLGFGPVSREPDAAYAQHAAIIAPLNHIRPVATQRPMPGDASHRPPRLRLAERAACGVADAVCVAEVRVQRAGIVGARKAQA